MIAFRRVKIPWLDDGDVRVSSKAIEHSGIIGGERSGAAAAAAAAADGEGLVLGEFFGNSEDDKDLFERLKWP